MSHELPDRDDMYGLKRDGAEVKTGKLKRLFRLDRLHIFTDDQSGEILPASLIKAKNNKKIGAVKGKTMKSGIAHSHDESHNYHIIEDANHLQTDLISRFKRWSKTHRDERKKSRDR